MPPDMLEQELISHSDWLQKLARSLVRDESAADDIVQMTYVAALGKPPEQREKLTSWLSTVLRNFARRSFRESGRRRNREQATARPEAIDPGDDPCEARELRKTLTQDVLSLREPYRSVVTLHFYGGHTAAEIGEIRGVATNTVRVQIKRGLALLREKFTSEDGDRRLAFLILLGGVGPGIEPVLLDQLRESAPWDSGSSSTARATDHRAMRSRGKVIALTLLTLAVLVWLFWDGTPGGSPTVMDPTAANQPTSTGNGLGATATRGSDHASRSTRDLTEQGVATNSLVPSASTQQVRVLNAIGGTPIRGATVSTGQLRMVSALTSGGRDAPSILSQPFASAVVGVTDEDGYIAVDVTEFASARLAVRATGFQEYREPCRSRTTDASPYVIVLDPAMTCSIEVLDEQDRPLARVPVTVGPSASGTYETLVSDRDGRVQFSWESNAVFYSIQTDGCAAASDVARAPSSTVRLRRGESWDCTVVDERGVPVVGAVVEMRTKQWRGTPLTTHSDEEGIVTLLAVTENEPVAVTVRHPHHPTTQSALKATDQTLIVLDDGAVVEGRATSPDGAALAGLRMRLIPQTGTFFARDLPEATSDNDGLYRFTGVAEGDYLLTGWHAEYRCDEFAISDLVAHETRRADVEMRAGEFIRGTVRDRSGAPVADVALQIGSILGDELWGPSITTDAEGRFELGGFGQLPPVRATRNDLRWGALAETSSRGDESTRATHGLLLAVERPFDLIRSNNADVPRFGFLGSRNTCRAKVGDTLDLVVDRTSTHRIGRLDFRSTTGQPIRTLSNLVLLPRDYPTTEEVIVFGGLDGWPRKIHDGSAILGARGMVYTREYAAAFYVWTASDTIPIVLEPRVARTLRISNTTGVPLGHRDLWITPEVWDIADAVYLGRTDDQGEVTFDFLGTGNYSVSLRDGPRGERAQVSVAPANQLSVIATLQVNYDDRSLNLTTTGNEEEKR